MKFMYPLGLLGLIGIPVLIIIYLIKNKHSEQTVSSTYLWELSEQFLKRKKRVNPITGLISLLLQILTVAAISLAIAHPVVVLPNKAKEFYFIIDASASMNMEKDGSTRLQRGKDKIESLIRDSVDGSVYSLVYVTDTTNIVYEQTREKKKAIAELSEVLPGYVETDYTSALGLAQSCFNENPGIKVYFVTDRAYANYDNIEVINVSDGEQNFAVSPLTATVSGSDLSVTGLVTAYEIEEPVEVTVDLYVNAAETPSQSKTVLLENGVPTEVIFEEKVGLFSSVRAVLGNVEDALKEDNETILYSVENENAYDTLLISDRPFLIRAAVEAAGNADVTVVSTEEYDEQRGYGLYIFDSYTPTSLPSDGAVWLINLTGSVPGAGFSYQGEEVLPEGETISLSTSSASMVQRLTKDMKGSDIYISKYLRYGLTRSFTTLMTYKSNPVVFTGVTENDNREVVFAFDILRDSDFTMHSDFTTLVRNLLDFSFPSVLEEVSYYSGETVEINRLSNMEAIRVEAPSGNHVYLNMSGAVCEYQLDEVGIHKITVTMSESGSQRNYYVYASVPELERNPYTEAEYVGLQGEATNGGLEGTFDPLKIVFIAIGVLFLADWVVYCYEKYQLR